VGGWREEEQRLEEEAEVLVGIYYIIQKLYVHYIDTFSGGADWWGGEREEEEGLDESRKEREEEEERFDESSTADVLAPVDCRVHIA